MGGVGGPALMAKPKPMQSTVMLTPLRSDTKPRGKRALLPKIRELKRLYLQGLDQIADIEEIIAAEEEA